MGSLIRNSFSTVPSSEKTTRDKIKTKQWQEIPSCPNIRMSERKHSFWPSEDRCDPAALLFQFWHDLGKSVLIGGGKDTSFFSEVVRLFLYLGITGLQEHLEAGIAEVCFGRAHLGPRPSLTLGFSHTCQAVMATNRWHHENLSLISDPNPSKSLLDGSL